MFGLSQERLNQKYLEEYVGEYGSVSEQQLDRIMQNAGFNGKKRHSYHNSLRMFSEINFDRATKSYYSSSYVSSNQGRELALDRIQWVLIDFLGRIEHHFRVSTDFSPSLICMMLENRSYELVYAASGQEAYLDNQLKAARMELLYRAESSFFSPIVDNDSTARIEATRYIILLEDISHAHMISSKQVSYFCELDEELCPVFFEPGNVKG